MTDPADEPLMHVAALRGGRRVTVRAICPDDSEAFESAFQRLSPGSRYTRFFAPLRELPPAMLDAATHPHADREVALVAVDGESAGQRIVGGGRFAWTPGKDSCEFAVTIADDWQGIGLARHMMESLIALARARGLRRMEGYVLPDNAGMRGLARRLGFTDTVCPDDRTLRLVALDLDQSSV